MAQACNVSTEGLRQEGCLDSEAKDRPLSPRSGPASCSSKALSKAAVRTLTAELALRPLPTFLG